MILSGLIGVAASCAIASLAAATPPLGSPVQLQQHELSVLVAAARCHERRTKARPVGSSAGKRDSEESLFLRTLDTALRAASRIELFAFEAPCVKCGRPAVTLGEVDKMGPPVLLAKESEQYLRKALVDGRSYLHGLRKAMPFVADSGVLISAEDKSVAVLFSSYGRSARLVSSDTAIAPSPVLSLTGSGMEMLSHIQGIIHKPR